MFPVLHSPFFRYSCMYETVYDLGIRCRNLSELKANGFYFNDILALLRPCSNNMGLHYVVRSSWIDQLYSCIYIYISYLPPYPIVCWVSTENRKHDVKSMMAETQGTKSGLSRFSCSKSPCCKKVRYQTTAKPSHEQKKAAANIRKIQCQDMSRTVMKMSWKEALCKVTK